MTENLRTNTKRFLFVWKLIFLFFFHFSLFCQKKNTQSDKSSSGKWIQIRHADVLRFDKNKSDAQILTGAVCCEHDGTFLYCDSAYLRANKTMDAYGNVRIVKGDSLQITGSEMHYDASSRMAVISGSVICMDRKMRLETSSLYFNAKTKTAGYFHGATIFNGQTVLKSKHGHYVSEEQMLYFHYDVDITDPDFRLKSDTLKYHLSSKTAYFLGPSVIYNEKDYIYCTNGYYNTQAQYSVFGKGSLVVSESVRLEGDSLYYDHKNERGQSRQRVRITDTSEKSSLYGDYAFYHARGPYFLITGHTLYSRKLGNDSLHFHADTLRYEVKDSINKYVRAQRGVAVFHPEYQARSDSMHLLGADSSLHFFGSPVLWSGRMQCSADTIHVFFSDSALKKIFLKTRVLLVQKSDTIPENKFFNQATGDSALILFLKGDISSARLKGENHMIHFILSKKKYTGFSRSRTGESVLYFKEGDLHRTHSRGKIQGTVYPMKEVSEDKIFLPVFFWEENRRPKNKKDIFQ